MEMSLFFQPEKLNQKIMRCFLFCHHFGLHRFTQQQPECRLHHRKMQVVTTPS